MDNHSTKKYPDISFTLSGMKCSAILILIFTLGIFSCKSDLEKARELSNTDDVQKDIAENVRLIYKEKGQLVAVITAPVMHRFFRNENRLVFPEGLAVDLYDNGIITCEIRAGFGERDETTKKMLATKGVVVTNYKPEKLETEEMVWDEVRQEIQADGQVRVTTPTDRITGYGLKADDRFRNYTMKRITGIVQVEDDNIPR
jgi:LPS export ABC transporter protein LptC